MEDAGAREDSQRSIQNLASFSAVLLALFTVASFTANSLLLATILSSSSLRSYVINYFIVHLAVVDLIDTVVNMLLTLVYISLGVETWQLGEGLCRLNAFTGQLVCILTVAGLTLLCIDRCLALTQMERYRHVFSRLRAASAIGFAWLLGLCFTLPVLSGSLASAVFLFRYFCAIDNGNPLAYSISLLLCCYLLPALTILGACAVIFMKARMERLSRRGQHEFASSIQIVVTRRFQDNLALSKFTVALVILFLLLQGPYIILNLLGLIRNSKEGIQGYGAPLSFPAESETAITWLKFVFPVVLPFIVFGFCRDIWRKFQDLVCCRRSNLIRSSAMTGSGELSVDGGEVRRSDSTTLRAPTLVATPAGLHIMAADAYAYADHRNRRNEQEQRVFDQLNENPPPTSDYSSEDSDSWANEALDPKGQGRPEPEGTERGSKVDLSQEVVLDGGVRKQRVEFTAQGQESADYSDEEDEAEQQVALSSTQLIIPQPSTRGHPKPTTHDSQPEELILQPNSLNHSTKDEFTKEPLRLPPLPKSSFVTTFLPHVTEALSPTPPSSAVLLPKTPIQTKTHPSAVPKEKFKFGFPIRRARVGGTVKSGSTNDIFVMESVQEQPQTSSAESRPSHGPPTTPPTAWDSHL